MFKQKFKVMEALSKAISQISDKKEKKLTVHRFWLHLRDKGIIKTYEMEALINSTILHNEAFGELNLTEG